MTVALTGLGVSRGIVIGRARILDDSELRSIQYNILSSDVEREQARYNLAIQHTIEQLQTIHTQVQTRLDHDITTIISTHILMLQDDSFIRVPGQIIRDQLCNAEWALQQQCEALTTIFDNMNDPYLRARRDDVENISTQLMRNLVHLDQNEVRSQHDKYSGLRDCILVTRDLSPAEVALYAQHGIAGLISTHGGPLSHAAIMARSLNLPAIAGAHHALGYIKHDENIIIDGQSGAIILDADSRLTAYYQAQKLQYQERLGRLDKLRHQAASSIDQQSISLLANVEQFAEIRTALDMGAEGVGLYRTELLYLDRKTEPDEEEQFEAYYTAARELDGKPLTIRTFDIGMDKQPAFIPGPDEHHNPALGMRGIRLCLQHQQLFRPHLRAILRASHYGQVRIMLPMLSNLQEVRQLRFLIKQVQDELSSEGIPFDQQIELGGMIEVPSAALSAHAFASQLDFLSIGTNDLIQYLLAIDRADDTVAYLYDPLHPAILKIIHYVIRSATRCHTPVMMCGEMAGDSLFTRLLLGMGLRHFSMQPYNLLEIKNIVAETNIRELQPAVRKILQLEDTNLILDATTELNNA